MYRHETKTVKTKSKATRSQEKKCSGNNKNAGTREANGSGIRKYRNSMRGRVGGGGEGWWFFFSPRSFAIVFLSSSSKKILARRWGRHEIKYMALV